MVKTVNISYTHVIQSIVSTMAIVKSMDPMVLPFVNVLTDSMVRIDNFFGISFVNNNQ